MDANFELMAKQKFTMGDNTYKILDFSIRLDSVQNHGGAYVVVFYELNGAEIKTMPLTLFNEYYKSSQMALTEPATEIATN